jgi:hypothetical protein
MRPLRWTVEAIGREFKLAQNTVRKILHQGGVEPDANGCYSTEQVTACLYGNLHAEKIRKERELVRKYQLENEITEASVLNRADLMKGLAGIADAMTSIISTSGLTTEEKENLLRELSSVPLILNTVARTQTKLRRSKNGQAVEEDASES